MCFVFFFGFFFGELIFKKKNTQTTASSGKSELPHFNNRDLFFRTAVDPARAQSVLGASVVFSFRGFVKLNFVNQLAFLFFSHTIASPNGRPLFALIHYQCNGCNSEDGITQTHTRTYLSASERMCLPGSSRRRAAHQHTDSPRPDILQGALKTIRHRHAAPSSRCSLL